MTEIVVARRDGTLKGPDGVRHRLVKGKTLADADHPAVVENPDAFMPVTIALQSEGGGNFPVPEDGVEDLRDQLAEVEETAERYRAQLAGIVEGLRARGLVDEKTDTSYEGWLSAVLFGAIDRTAHATPTVAEVPTETEPLKTPRAPRRRPASAGAGSDADES